MMTKTATTKRIHNFSAGPATMPLPVLKRAQEELVNIHNTGMSVMEMSHRSKPFDAIIKKTESDFRSILAIPDNYDVLFLQGGASLQFSMVPMNLAEKQKEINVINTGSWTKKAIEEAKKHTAVTIVGSSEPHHFSYIPKVSESEFNQEASYAYITSNNTIFGTQYHHYPSTGNIPLVADMSSDILFKPIDVSKFGLIFAGAQKNIGPSGVTVVILRKDLADRSPKNLPSMLNYNNHINTNSLYNTPSTFGIYMMGLVLEWIQEKGGLEVIARQNKQKAELLYHAIENSSIYQCPVQTEDRSWMNVVFRINNDEALESQFVAQATDAGLNGLKGHRSVGGLRASIYNACSLESVQALVNFMQVFEKKL